MLLLELSNTIAKDCVLHKTMTYIIPMVVICSLTIGGDKYLFSFNRTFKHGSYVDNIVSNCCRFPLISVCPQLLIPALEETKDNEADCIITI